MEVPVVVTATPEAMVAPTWTATPVPVATAAPVFIPTPELAIAVAQPAPAATPVPELIQAHGTFNYYHPVRWGGEESLDPASRQRWEPITEMVYDRLFGLDQSGQPRPILVEAWEVTTSPPKLELDI